jgi:hypothetical protein
MMEETHHFVLSRFERTRNSLERILTINHKTFKPQKAIAHAQRAL